MKKLVIAALIGAFAFSAAAAEKEKKYEKPATETSSYLACGTS